ncbi:hypothetical protein MKW92_052508 [Papaver armeniacum]|nr:hypothetical protein MKW92_052508 [Papaver armeniacum]
MCLIEVFGKCFGLIDDERDNQNGHQNKIIKVKGTVVLMKKNMMDMTDFFASLLDHVHELCGKGVCLQLISSDNADPENEMRGKVTKEAYLEEWVKKSTSLTAGLSEFHVTFQWDEPIGNPGAFLIKNYHHSEFLLKTLTLEDVPGVGVVHFVCNSWVYPSKRYKYSRVFFSNQSYLTSDTPEPLRKYREDELKILRGDGTGELQAWDRVYDYALYNDLGTNRPILGNSTELPYPRRGRTGRKPIKKDPNYESQMFVLNLNIYVPRDEKFSQLKFSDFLANSMKGLGQIVHPELRAIFDKTPNEFDCFEDVHYLYEGYQGRADQPVNSHSLSSCCCFSLEFIKEIFRSDGAHPLKFPKPGVIQADEVSWRSDEEFGREMLAGVNPVAICLLQNFPPTSTLDPTLFGNHTSSVTKEHIEKNLNGLTVDEALEKRKLFILDHHDHLIPYLNRINATGTKTYATRTLLLLQDNGTLKPLAIELSLPHPDGAIYGVENQVYTPAQEGVQGSIWQLAKAYAVVNDSGVHQLISHWLYTHAVIEPFIIATNRQLSVLHPIYKLLQPHFRDTMNINALARQILIYGFIERCVFPGKFSMELSAKIYKGWNFTEQALPESLLKRGIAVQDPSKPLGLRLLIEDYPFAVDGLEIWSAIHNWVLEYCSFYYPSDDLIQDDRELQSWWEDIRSQGHGDLKYEPWWPKMQTLSELTQSCTTIIWVSSALHAAVNFGQYPYAGYLPNRPTTSRRFMPKIGTHEYEELSKNPDLVFLQTINCQLDTLLVISLIENLSKHSTDEVFLGQREYPEFWTKDKTPLEAKFRFGEKLVNIENRIVEMNSEERWRNRTGPVKIPYTLLCPYPLPYDPLGLTGRGIPNNDERDNQNDQNKIIKVKGTVVLMKKNMLDVTDCCASLLDRVHELCGKGVCLQLISSVNGDPENEMRGKVSKEAYLEDWNHKISSFTAEAVEFNVTFEWDESIGVPGAFLIKNFHHSEFLLKTLTLEDVPEVGPVYFVCNSWVYPSKRYKCTRVFFSNQSYLTNNTPEPLRKYRDDELKNLRGDGTGERQAWDRVYDYALYNDLGTGRPVLGNTIEFPYPRREGPEKTHEKRYESEIFKLSLNVYVPSDERFSQIKLSDFLAYGVKALSQGVRPELKAIFDKAHNEFNSFEDVLHLYDGYQGQVEQLADSSPSVNSNRCLNLELVKEIFRSDGEKPFKFPKPDVIQADEFAWRSDEEFGREMLAGLNPIAIRLLKEFPPTSKLDPRLYGDHTSSITKSHIEKNMNGLTVEEALENNKLFTLDYHDELIPYLNRINTTETKTYATRTILLLQEDGTLKPLAIELSLVHPDGEIYGAENKVYIPSQEGVEGSIWQLAKAYAVVNDSGFHQFISHWLYTHCVIEPFIIAANRQLSVLHPIHKLLQPHFRDTMNINAVSRHINLTTNGFFEQTVCPDKFGMEMSSTIYRDWNFTEQALPENLIKRGIAVRDPSKPHGLRMLIEDYPFAVDGLEIWSAIENWVNDYCSFYYPTDDLIQGDAEIQSWWEELRTKGHDMHGCTTIIWIASALHAAVNFGQYQYAGYGPNRPTVSRLFMPEPGTSDYDELEKNPDLVFLKTITSQLQTLLGMSLIEGLSKHSADEIFLGQRECPDHWTKDAAPLEAFKSFGEKLVNIENTIVEMNNEEQWKNRVGPVKVPYTLLCPYPLPSNPVGLTGRGIPNSVSI